MTPLKNLPSLDEFTFSWPLEVRFRDIDAMGHVNNAVYFTYFEIARTAYFRAIGFSLAGADSYTALFPFILAETNCRFLLPIVLQDRLLIHIRTSHLGRSSFRFDYVITDEKKERIFATAWSAQVYFDYVSGKSMEMPKNFREMIEKFEGKSLSQPEKSDSSP
jgi:acyl-CoA thioester hydrolase